SSACFSIVGSASSLSATAMTVSPRRLASSARRSGKAPFPAISPRALFIGRGFFRFGRAADAALAVLNEGEEFPDGGNGFCFEESSQMIFNGSGGTEDLPVDDF